MKNNLLYCFLLIFMVMAAFNGARSQAIFSSAPAERVEASTDRSLYITGEKVFFTAVIFQEKNNDTTQLSKILYVELITPDGVKITGGKFRVEKFSANGCLIIPEEAITGNYFLRFYTRYMRNLSPEKYKYLMLKIVNPNKTEVLSGKSEWDQSSLDSQPAETRQGELSVLTEKSRVAPREVIRVRLKTATSLDPASVLCLSVVPEGTFSTSSFSFVTQKDAIPSGFFYPETRGVTLSGQLKKKGAGEPIRATRVNMSIIGEKDIQATHSDSTGNFCFSLPEHQGRKDIFLCAEDLPDITPEILITNDFCSKTVNLRAPAFTLSDEEMKAAYQLAVNARISAVFAEDSGEPAAPAVTSNISFYGTPSQILYIDKYIDLPTLEDYFTELPVLVKVRKSEGRKQFRFQSPETDLSNYDPLVLIDWVTVSDIRKILAMSPSMIDRIEVVDALWYKGDITYGGIISFISKKNDFAGIDLPASGTFVNYLFQEDCQPLKSTGNLSPLTPDPRNTVFWDPAVQLNASGETEITFSAPDTPGRYVVLFREAGTGKSARQTIVVE